MKKDINVTPTGVESLVVANSGNRLLRENFLFVQKGMDKKKGMKSNYARSFGESRSNPAKAKEGSLADSKSQGLEKETIGGHLRDKKKGLQEPEKGDRLKDLEVVKEKICGYSLAGRYG